MSSFTHCLVLMFALVACENGRAGDPNAAPKAVAPPPARGVPIEDCIGTGTGHRASAYAAYVKAGGRALDGDVVNGAPSAAIYLGNGDGERSELRDNCCTEQFPPVVATGYRCRLYIDNRDLAQAMLIDRGWLAANPAKKLALAKAIDGLVLPGPLAAPPPGWASGKKTFTPPAITVDADGSVTFVAWHRDEKRTEWGGGKNVYSREQWSISADGMTSAVKNLEVAELDYVSGADYGSSGTFRGVLADP